MSRPTIPVSIKSTETVFFEGECDSVSSRNSDGPFDILPYHSNFISIVEKVPIVVRQGREQKSFDFSTAVIYVHENKVHIYANL